MKLRKALPTLLIASVATLGLIAGCNKKTDKTKTVNGKTNENKTPGANADPHDIPLTKKEIQELRDSVPTYEKALARIKEFGTKIKKETTVATRCGRLGATCNELDRTPLFRS